MLGLGLSTVDGVVGASAWTMRLGVRSLPGRFMSGRIARLPGASAGQVLGFWLTCALGSAIPGRALSGIPMRKLPQIAPTSPAFFCSTDCGYS